MSNLVVTAGSGWRVMLPANLDCFDSIATLVRNTFD